LRLGEEYDPEDVFVVGYSPALNVEVTVDGTDVAVTTFADNCGNLVAQCSKEVAKAAIQDFSGRTTQVPVTLSVCGAIASEDIVIRK
jgi:hypothetical protein